MLTGTAGADLLRADDENDQRNRVERIPGRRDAMNDGWIEWRGGTTRPVAADVPVAVKFRDGVVWRVFPACELSWHHSGKGDDIIAYRVAEPEATAPTSPAFDRVAACIALRVPESGIPELDALIAKAQRRDVAAMIGVQIDGWCTQEAIARTDELLAALERKPENEP